jgi:AmmeMemoRadiSam system protein B
MLGSKSLDLRAPAVAGRFYPGEAATLAAEVDERLEKAARTPRKHLGVLAPHAGYVYSGAVAATVFADTVVPRRVIVLAPNHTGEGARGAVWARGAFALPGYQIPVDEALATQLLSPPLVADRRAHRHEHALEVELPFLRARRPDVTITPIILGSLTLDECLAVGESLARVVASLPDEVLVVASSDLSHYLTDEETRVVDARAIEPLCALDPERLYRTVHDEEISMCGVLPATAMLAYARARGATRAELLAYATSADAFGDTSRVVGYGGVSVD